MRPTVDEGDAAVGDRQPRVGLHRDGQVVLADQVAVGVVEVVLGQSRCRDRARVSRDARRVRASGRAAAGSRCSARSVLAAAAQQRARSPPRLAAIAGTARSGSVCAGRSRALAAVAPGARHRPSRSPRAARRRASAPRRTARAAFWISGSARSGPIGWLSPLTMLPMSSPAAAALTSIPGSIGGSNSGMSWTLALQMFSQLRILVSRSSTVSQ